MTRRMEKNLIKNPPVREETTTTDFQFHTNNSQRKVTINCQNGSKVTSGRRLGGNRCAYFLCEYFRAFPLNFQALSAARLAPDRPLPESRKPSARNVVYIQRDAPSRRRVGRWLGIRRHQRFSESRETSLVKSLRRFH